MVSLQPIFNATAPLFGAVIAWAPRQAHHAGEAG